WVDQDDGSVSQNPLQRLRPHRPVRALCGRGLQPCPHGEADGGISTSDDERDLRVPGLRRAQKRRKRPKSGHQNHLQPPQLPKNRKIYPSHISFRATRPLFQQPAKTIVLVSTNQVERNRKSDKIHRHRKLGVASPYRLPKLLFISWKRMLGRILVRALM